MWMSLLIVVSCLASGFSNAALLGETCGGSTECSNAVTNSECDVEGTCICIDGFIQEPNKNDQCYEDLGGSCVIQEQCTLNNTICGGEEGAYKCTCTDNYVANAAKNDCVKRASFLEEPCEVEDQCLGIIDSLCNLPLGQCRCINNYVPNTELDMCLPRKHNLDDVCSVDLQCSVDGSQCVHQKCTCISDTHIEYDARCLPLIGTIQIGRCEVSGQCPANSQCLMNGSDRKCLCNDGFLKNHNWTECVAKRFTIGGTCEMQEQCMVDDSVCELEGATTFCNCKTGTVASADFKNCITASETLGAECEINTQCLVFNSLCSGNTCECEKNYVPQGTTGCLRRQDIESGVCAISSQCPEHAQCLSEGSKLVCKCSTGYVKNSAGTACLPIRQTIGGVCEETIQCEVNKAECVLNEDSSQKWCLCPQDHVTNNAFSVCEKKANKIGEVCSINEQCGALNGFCMGAFGRGTCICKFNSDANNDLSYCLPNILNGPCQKNADCSAWEYSACRSGTCKCTTGSIENSARDECLKTTTVLGEACKIKEQCLAENSDCLGEPEAMSCQCKSDHVQMPGTNTCLKKAEKLRDECSNSIQCRHFGTAALCNTVLKECRCNSVNVESEDLSTCLRKVNILGGICNITAQCITPSSECKLVNREKVCACKSGTIPSGNTCLQVAEEIGDSCRENDQCGWDNAECSGPVGAKTCACTSNYVSSINKKMCLRRATIVGGECTEPDQCTSNIPNTKCEGGSCRCNSYYEPSGENTECLRLPADIGGTCNDDIKCEIAGAECTTRGLCSCKIGSGYTANSNSCEQKNLQGGCETGVPCAVPGSACLNSGGSTKCICDSNNVQSEKECLPKATFTDSACEVDTQCTASFPNTECASGSGSGKCKCLDTHVANAEKKKCLAKLDQSCTTKQDCTLSEKPENVDCINKFCKCTGALKPDLVNNKCVNSGVRNTLTFFLMIVVLIINKLL